MTDKELIRKVHSGDRKAFSLIAERYYDEIYRFCRYYTGHEEDAYDITQEVFLRFIKYADSYRHRNLKGYLLMIARNLCRDYFFHKTEILQLEAVPDHGEYDKAIEELADQLHLQKILMELPDQQKEVIVLKTIGELKFREIAQITGCNLSTVKSRYRIGIAAVKKRMEDEDEKKG
ncbi:MAG: RNA polymerase sigma factor [Lachnospiraceae bacterium]|nr:RNA polymerase sigma factor [Lachnospiraceae bacterium]